MTGESANGSTAEASWFSAAIREVGLLSALEASAGLSTVPLPEGPDGRVEVVDVLARTKASLNRAGLLDDIDRVIVAGPELGLLEILADLDIGDIGVTVTLPADTPAASATRIERNMPAGIRGSVVQVPDLPSGPFSPQSTVLLVAGINAGYVTYLPVWIAELLLFWDGFLFGPRVLIDPVALPVERPAGWVSVTTEHLFTSVCTITSQEVLD